MNFFQLIIRRSVGTFLIIAAAVILGLFFVQTLAVSFYPDFSVPALFINTAYPGAGPETVESEVSKLIEESISTISGIDEIQSTSSEGFSLVRVAFAFGEDIDLKNQEIQEKLDRVAASLPRDALVPVIIKINDFLAPPIELAISSDSLSLGELRQYADDRLGPQLSRLSGVGAVNINGGTEQVVAVEIPPLRLLETGLSLGQIANVIRANNLDFPIGGIDGKASSFLVRLSGKFESVEDIRNLTLPLQRGRSIKLGQLADVRLQEKRQTSYTRVNRKNAVGLLVRKKTGGNSIEVADNVKAWIKENSDSLPPGVDLQIISDESIFIQKSINDVLFSLLLGALLAAFVIFLFLGNLRNTLVIILSIPASLIISFLLMRIFNLSINTVSLGGMGMAVGMVVDSAIVVMENSIRHLEQKDLAGNRLQVIAKSTSEVFLAISASVLTTIVVFLPLAFTSGLAQVLLGELSLVVVFTLSISILIAATLVPVLSFYLLKIESRPNPLSAIFMRLLDKGRDAYAALLTFALRHRALLLLAFIVMLGGAGFLASRLETGLFPEADQGLYQINLEYPVGTSLDYTNDKTIQLEKWLLRKQGIKLVSSFVGEDLFFGTDQSNSATINVNTDGSVASAVLIDQTRQYLKDKPGLKSRVRVLDASAGFNSRDLDITIKGSSIAKLRELGLDLEREFRQVEGLVNVESSLKKGLPAFIFVPDKQRLNDTGLNAFDLAQAVRAAKSGTVASNFEKDGFDIDIELSFKDADQYSLEKIKEIPVVSRQGTILPLKALGIFKQEAAPAEIKRIGQQRSVTVTADVAEGYDSQKVKKNAEEVQDSFMKEQLPEDYVLDKSRGRRGIIESFKTLGFALIIAVFLVYIVMGVQFNSLLMPFVIALSIPFSFTGAFALLAITDTPLNLPSFLGLIMLAGIVVNNGILLLDFALSIIKEKQQTIPALLEAGKLRFRPIVLTTLTTIFGMLFLAIDIGGGGSALKPLAIAVIGGLVFSLLVSLIFVPVLFSLFPTRKLAEKQ